jgi:hypothetical protein
VSHFSTFGVGLSPDLPGPTRSVASTSPAPVATGRDTLAAVVDLAARSEAPEATRSGPSTAGVVAAFVAISALYLVFVANYSVDIVDNDDWGVMPLIHSALHGHLTLGALWAQHNENRMFVPNVAMVALGVATRDNVQVVMFVSAGIFIATFAGFLVLFRSYVGRLNGWAVLGTGVVWFSVVDWMNALWAFQLAWYLIAGFLVAMLYLLVVRTERWAFGIAVACAVLASYSSLQGLLLWPVGLLCLVWVRPWSRRRVVTWVSPAVVATAVYFIGYRSNPPSPDGLFAASPFGTSSPTYTLSHPVFAARFILVVIGDGLPLHSNARDPWVAELVGVAVLVGAGYVVWRAVMDRRSRMDCLPVALIGFGLVFDLMTTIGRVGYGRLDGAFASRYSMASLFILLGVLTYAWANVRPHTIPIAVLGCLLALQVGTSAHYGIEQAVASNDAVNSGARIVANEQPPHGCDALTAVFDFVPSGLTASFMRSMEADRLNLFAPGPLAHYRAEGLPKLAACKS